MSLSSIAHRMNVDFASTLALTTKPFDGASANDAPAAAYEHHVLPTNATRQAVALVDTAKAIDTHLDDFFSASKELQDRLADISTTSHTSQSQQQLSEIDILERDVLCCVAELRRSEAMVTRHMEVVTKAVEVLEQADKANAPLTENLFAFKK